MKCAFKKFFVLSVATTAFVAGGNLCASAQVILNPGFSIGADEYNPPDWTSSASNIAFEQRNGEHVTYSGADPSGYFTSLGTPGGGPSSLTQDLGSLSGTALGTFTFGSSVASNANGHNVDGSDTLSLAIFDNTLGSYIASDTISGASLNTTNLMTFSVTSSVVSESDDIVVGYLDTIGTAGHQFTVTDAQVSFTPSAPEPSSWALVLVGSGLMFVGRRALRRAS